MRDYKNFDHAASVALFRYRSFRCRCFPLFQYRRAWIASSLCHRQATSQNSTRFQKLSMTGPTLHFSSTRLEPPVVQKECLSSELKLAFFVQNIKLVYKLTESDSTVLVPPLFHVHGLITGLLSSLVACASVNLPSSGRFSASNFWLDMVRYNAMTNLLDRHLSKPNQFIQTYGSFGAVVHL